MQVLNIRNVSAPKANQESKTSPRLLQIDLTDGQTLCSGLEMENISALSINIAPGTKVMVKNSLKVIQGMLSFNAQNISVIGGQVANLYEKWEINRTLAKYAQGARRPATNADGSGPPPWIPFGQKLAQTNNDKSFKSLTAATGDKSKEPSKENSEFLASRNEAIAEATKLSTKKVFGGGNRQLMDYNVKKIMDKGFTEEQAKYALKLARNNLERAMSNLKRRNAGGEDDRKGIDPNKPRGPGYRNEEKYNSGPGPGRRGGKNEAADGAIAAKPSGKVSLFDFLEDKIKIPATVEKPALTQSSGPPKTSIKQTSNNTSNNYKGGQQSNSNPRYNTRNDSQHNSSGHSRSKFENNISSSFASRHKKDDDVPHSRNNNNNNSNYNSNRANNPKWNDGSNTNSYGSKNVKSSFPPYSQSHSQQQSNYNRQNSNNSSSDNSKYQSNSKFQNNNNSQNQHQPNNSNYYNSGNNYQSNNNSSRYNSSKNHNSGADNNHQYSDMVRPFQPIRLIFYATLYYSLTSFL